MKKLAHRGYSAHYPENTMLAFSKAIERGFDGIETDVHLTKDGNLVLCHDEKINRTSNGKGYIKDMTLEQLRAYSFNNGMKYDERIPLLEELLLLIKDKDILLNIELKTDNIHYQGIERKVYDLVNKIGVQDQVIYSSFYLPSLLKMREIDNNVYIGYLFEYSLKKKNIETIENHIFYVHPKYTMLKDKTMLFYKQNNIEVATWTVPNKDEYLRLKKLGVKISISNEYFED